MTVREFGQNIDKKVFQCTREPPEKLLLTTSIKAPLRGKKLIHYFFFAQHAVTTEGKTLLPQYLGMYRLTVNNAETYWMVMRNVFSSTVKIHRKFDLKGSRVDRAASHKEKVHLTVH